MGPKRHYLSCSGHQVSQSAEVVSGSGEGKQPPNLLDPSQLHFLWHPHHLHPPERLFHSFSLPLAHLITCVPCGPLIHSAPAVRVVLRQVRSDIHPTKLSDQLPRVVVLVPSQRHPFSAGEGLRHEHRSISFRSSIGLDQKSLHQKPVAVLHQYMSQVAQLRLAAFGLLEQPGIGIRRGSMGLVLPLLPVKVDLPARSGRLPHSVLSPETLLASPSLDQCPVHCEMFVRNMRPRTLQHPL